MSTKQADEIRRHDDGTIDIGFYARRGSELRRAAKIEFMSRTVTWGRRLLAASVGAMGSVARELMRRLSPTRL